METFAERLKIIKEENRLKGTELAKLMGVSRQAINNYFREDNPSKPRVDHVEKLCEYFGYNYKWLMYGSGAKKAQTPANYKHNVQAASKEEEPEVPMMSIVNVLEAYYKEIDIIKNLLNLKQDTYGKVIFPQGK